MLSAASRRLTADSRSQSEGRRPHRNGLLRVLGSRNVAVMMDRVRHNRRAADTHQGAHAMSCPVLRITQRQRKKYRKPAKPACRTFLRPNRSPMETNSQKQRRKYQGVASTIHCKPFSVAPKSREIEGKGRFKTVLSREITSSASARKPSATQRLLYHEVCSNMKSSNVCQILIIVVNTSNIIQMTTSNFNTIYFYRIR